MVHADISELSLIAMGAIGAITLAKRQYKSIEVVSHTSVLSAEPTHGVGRTVFLAVRVWLSTRFYLADDATLKNYKRFRSVIDRLVFLAVVNFILILAIIVGLFMASQQTGPQTKIRHEDLALIIGYFSVFIAGYAGVDWLNDAIKDRQLKSVSDGRMREHPSERRAFRILQPREGAMRKPILPSPEIGPENPDSSKASRIYPALSEEERNHLKSDPEAVKQDLIAAGILTESGELRDEYKNV